jgi:thiol:disulfide interchange protein DsbA
VSSTASTSRCYHDKKQRLSTRDALREFFVAHGVDGAEFDKTFNSFAVQSKVSRSKDLSQRYGIDGVPAMIIDGKFRVGAGQAGSYKNLVGIAEYVARKLHAGEPLE